MFFSNFENFEKIGLKIVIIAPKNGVFLRLFYFTVNLELVSGKFLNWSKNW